MKIILTEYFSILLSVTVIVLIVYVGIISIENTNFNKINLAEPISPFIILPFTLPFTIGLGFIFSFLITMNIFSNKKCKS